MTDQSGLQELYRLHSDSQSKYVYFLLAAAGAALGYGLQKLDGVPFSWWVAPGLLSLAFWLASFFCGCKRITWVQSAIYANYALLQLRHGLHPEQPPHPQLVQLAMDGTSTAIKNNTSKARTYMTLQYYFLALGVLSFVVWRLVEMARVTYAA
jgi:hypothetical protein